MNATESLFSLSVMGPEILVGTVACVVLVIDLYLPQSKKILSYWVSVLCLLVAAVWLVSTFTIEPQSYLGGMFLDDGVGDLLKLFILVVSAGVFIYSRKYLPARGLMTGEYYVLGLFGVLGMMVMASAGHFLLLYLGLELLSLCMYAMVAFERDKVSATEAAMKYFVLGALASGMLLYGMSILYGLTGSLEISVVRAALADEAPTSQLPLVFALVFIVVALCFKLGAVPFHMWLPDVYHGAPTASTAYIGTAPKLAAFALIFRLLVEGLGDLAGAWQQMLIVVALLSVVIGNLMALAQTNMKRMLAYSTIAHMGFFLLGILSASGEGYSAGLFYAIVYAVMGLAAFGMIILLTTDTSEADTINDFQGLASRRLWYAVLMMLVMFSMAGIPPFAGFWAKLGVVKAVVNAGYVWVAVIAVVAAVVGAFYYLRIIKLMFFDKPVNDEPIVAPGEMRIALSINALLLLVSLPFIGPMIDFCARVVGATLP